MAVTRSNRLFNPRTARLNHIFYQPCRSRLKQGDEEDEPTGVEGLSRLSYRLLCFHGSLAAFALKFDSERFC